MRNSRLEHAGQIKQAYFFTSGGKSEVRSHDFPAATTIRNFQTQRLRLFLLSLADGDINRRVGRMHPAIRDQPQRSVRGRVAEVELNVMISRHPLVSPALECAEIVSVQ